MAFQLAYESQRTLQTDGGGWELFLKRIYSAVQD